MALTEEQQKAIELLSSGKNVFLTGGAGVGKTFVINEFKKQSNKRIISIAPTGIAAMNLGGCTIHRQFKAPCRPIEPGSYSLFTETRALLKNIDVIIIDEISMCRCDLFDYVITTVLYVNPNIQIILVGDLYQLPPVITPEDRTVLKELYGDNFEYGFMYEGKMYEQLDVKIFELKEIQRQKGDKDFAQALNAIRELGPLAYQEIKWINEHATITNDATKGITLAATHREVDKINKEYSESFYDIERFVAQSVGDVKSSDKPVPDIVDLAEGMIVVCVVNDSDKANRYQNGSIGEVVGFGYAPQKIWNDYANRYVEVEKYAVFVDFDGEIVPIFKQTWKTKKYCVVDKKVIAEVVGTYTQYPLFQAAAMTIHKSQGKTYSKLHLIPFCNNPGQLYTALSRVRTISGLTLKYPISTQWARRNICVKRFYEGECL